MTITAEQAQFYKDNGFLGAIDILPPEEAVSYRQQFDVFEATFDKETAQIGLVDKHFEQEFIWELATHPRILDAVEAVIGPNFHLLATHFFNKQGDGAETEAFVAWHQDVTFWGLDPAYAITAWYAVDDSDQENGCMQVIPNTHHGIVEHGKSDQAGNLLSINQEVEVTPEMMTTAVDLPLKAGQMSLHDGTLIHGSLPNRSNRRRCGLTLRYVPTWVKQIEDNSHGAKWNSVLVRGEDAEKNFGERALPFPIKTAA